ncbi:uncharacterized protein LOC109726724 [Ananas comosus]|uniref:Uncharacterized protein LOC109726724 n=1 Tax=Ananas comosus TaxID=4615 RepID=A0A6P5H2J0_ANACO|nr:uncharacterized protein LOC109726724 [Ananas comosus]
MELLHSQEAAKKLCHFLRLAFFMVIKKSLIISRKKLMIMGLILKRGKLLGKAMKNLLPLINHPKGKALPPPTRMEYEFSCSNTPNLIFFKSRSKRRGNTSSLFSCFNAGCYDESVAPVFVFPTLEYSPRCVYGSSFIDGSNYKERRLGLSPSRSPFLVRVSSCSSEAEEEEEEEEEEGVECDVNDKAEEFIERFYEQLRAQSLATILA